MSTRRLGLLRVRVRVRVRVRARLGGRVVGSVVVWHKLRLGGEVVGSVHVATPGSAHGTFVELQFLIMPQHHVHIPPRPLSFRRYKPTKK